MKFDNEATYIRKFVPELKGLPTKYIFCPFEYDNNTLEAVWCKIRKKLSFACNRLCNFKKESFDTYTKFINKN